MSAAARRRIVFHSSTISRNTYLRQSALMISMSVDQCESVFRKEKKRRIVNLSARELRLLRELARTEPAIWKSKSMMTNNHPPAATGLLLSNGSGATAALRRFRPTNDTARRPAYEKSRRDRKNWKSEKMWTNRAPVPRPPFIRLPSSFTISFHANSPGSENGNNRHRKMSPEIDGPSLLAKTAQTHCFLASLARKECRTIPSPCHKRT